MKRLLILVLMSFLMVCGLAGCGGQEARPAEEEPEAQEEETKLSGGWEVETEGGSVSLPEEVKASYESAMDMMTGTEFVPIAYFSRRDGEETGYQILCRSTLTTADPQPQLQVVVINTDAQGRAEVTNIAGFEIGRYTDGIGAAAGGADSGGWYLPEDYTKAELPEKVKKVYEKGIGQAGEGSFTPMAFLGSQIVAGTNYAVLVCGEGTSSAPKGTVQMAAFYEDLNGNVELSNMFTLEPEDYDADDDEEEED